MAALSPTDVVDVLDADVTTEKRAQWEAFEFTVLGGGDVEVVNDSHENPDDHTYTVHVESGIPSDCTCPAWEYQEGACKHMVAVVIREPVIEAVATEPTLKTDGGLTVEVDESDHSNERPDDCDCSPFFEEFPCWPCYWDGLKEPAEVSEE